MEFAAIDVETANPDMASICQIGVAEYRDGDLVNEWTTLINPEDYFDPLNVSIHGISEIDVARSPTFPAITEKLHSLLGGRITVCHTHFDRSAITKAHERYGLPPLVCMWLDSASVTRRTWKEFSQSGYGLGSICDFLQYEFRHHDALEDAKAAGYIIHKAMEETGLTLDDWLEQVKRPITPDLRERLHALAPNPDGYYHGEVIVFTGKLNTPRAEAAAMAADLGFNVEDGVTKHTTYLVVGDQDIAKLAGHTKSAKHRKAEHLIAKGQAIRILKESDFARLRH